jgi:hypothetical protein
MLFLDSKVDGPCIVKQTLVISIFYVIANGRRLLFKYNLNSNHEDGYECLCQSK